jgi:hypothetical protein
MNDIFPPLSELMWREIVWLAALFGYGVCIGAFLILPVAGAFATLHRTSGSTSREQVVGWTGFSVAVLLLAVLGVWMFAVTFPGIIEEWLILPLFELVPWLLIGLALVGAPWLLWVTTTKPKTKTTWAALVAVYSSALVTAIWTMISYR